MAASTYVVSGRRAGYSAVVAETDTKTYVTAAPAVVKENGSGGGGGGGSSGAAFVVVAA
jgi:hypothetical protein